MKRSKKIAVLIHANSLMHVALSHVTYLETDLFYKKFEPRSLPFSYGCRLTQGDPFEMTKNKILLFSYFAQESSNFFSYVKGL